MKRFVSLVLICKYFLYAPSATAQYYFYNEKYHAGNIIVEAGGSAGIMNCLTDIGGQKGIGKNFIKDLNWRVTKPGFSLYATGTYKDIIGLRLDATVGSIASYDSILKESDPNLGERYGRNLSFRSRITDFQLAIEFHPLFLKSYENEAPYLSPYFVTGIGLFFFNPQAFLDGHWYFLQPLRLEGQGFAEYPGHKPYKCRQFNLPLGAGIKYELSAVVHLRFEIVHRILFTDYLDDVSTQYIDASLFQHYLQPAQAAIAQKLYSRMQELQPGYRISPGMQRGDSKDKDAFFTIQLKLGWVFRRGVR